MPIKFGFPNQEKPFLSNSFPEDSWNRSTAMAFYQKINKLQSNGAPKSLKTSMFPSEEFDHSHSHGAHIETHGKLILRTLS